MNTDNLITALAADLETRPTPVWRALVNALVLSTPIAVGLLIYVLDVRPDIRSAFSTVRFDFKLAFMLGLAASAVLLVSRLSRPGASARSALLTVAAAIAVLLAAVVLEMTIVPRTDWMPTLVGTMSIPCVVLIPFLAATPLAAILFALKSGAPDNTAATGGAAGLLAGAIGAACYAPHCPNDSPLFVAVWYLIAIAAVALVGSLIGSRLLRW